MDDCWLLHINGNYHCYIFYIHTYLLHLLICHRASFYIKSYLLRILVLPQYTILYTYLLSPHTHTAAVQQSLAHWRHLPFLYVTHEAMHRNNFLLWFAVTALHPWRSTVSLTVYVTVSVTAYVTTWLSWSLFNSLYILSTSIPPLPNHVYPVY